MNYRRTSGEILNATLLEVFLSFTFVVLTIAWFWSQIVDESIIVTNRNQDYIATLEKKISELGQEVARLKDDNKRLGQENDRLSQENDRLKKENEALKQKIKVLGGNPDGKGDLPGVCIREGAPRHFLTITLLPEQKLQVLVNRDELNYQTGQTHFLSSSDFLQMFREVFEESKRKNCRFSALIKDLTNTKEEYKTAKKVVESRFYVSE